MFDGQAGEQLKSSPECAAIELLRHYITWHELCVQLDCDIPAQTEEILLLDGNGTVRSGSVSAMSFPQALYLRVYVSEVITPYYAITYYHVRSYVISRQHFIKSSYVIK